MGIEDGAHSLYEPTLSPAMKEKIFCTIVHLSIITVEKNPEPWEIHHGLRSPSPSLIFATLKDGRLLCAKIIGHVDHLNLPTYLFSVITEERVAHTSIAEYYKGN
jgi:hypothetical protein